MSIQNLKSKNLLRLNYVISALSKLLAATSVLLNLKPGLVILGSVNVLKTFDCRQSFIIMLLQHFCSRTNSENYCVVLKSENADEVIWTTIACSVYLSSLTNFICVSYSAIAFLHFKMALVHHLFLLTFISLP